MAGECRLLFFLWRWVDLDAVEMATVSLGSLPFFTPLLLGHHESLI